MAEEPLRSLAAQQELSQFQNKPLNLSQGSPALNLTVGLASMEQLDAVAGPNATTTKTDILEIEAGSSMPPLAAPTRGISPDKMLFVTDQGPRPSESDEGLGSLSDVDKDIIEFVDHRAPSPECLATYSAHLSVSANRQALHLQMKALFEKADRERSEQHPQRGLSLTHDSVGLLFHLCTRLKTSVDVKYKAIEIYDRFVFKFEEEIKKQIHMSDKVQVDAVHTRFRQQAILRMITSIQLASKIQSSGGFAKYISCAQLKTLLLELNNNFTISSIKESEKRVFSVLNWKLAYVTSMDIVEIVLIQLGLDVDTYRKVYSLSTYILDYVHSHRSLVHEKFFESLFTKYKVTKETFREFIKFNVIFEGIAIIETALLGFCSWEHAAINTLEKIGKFETRDLREFSAVVLALGFAENSEFPMTIG